jgi:hypothetical protein
LSIKLVVQKIVATVLKQQGTIPRLKGMIWCQLIK